MYLPTLTEPTPILCESMSKECRLNYFLLFLLSTPSPPLKNNTNWKSSERMGFMGFLAKLGLGFQVLVSLSVSICRHLTNILSQGLQQEEEEEEEEEEDDEEEERWKRERVMRIL